MAEHQKGSLYNTLTPEQQARVDAETIRRMEIKAAQPVDMPRRVLSPPELFALRWLRSGGTLSVYARDGEREPELRQQAVRRTFPAEAVKSLLDDGLIKLKQSPHGETRYELTVLGRERAVES